MKYSIEETTLTNIGDALRRRHGETKIGTVTEKITVYGVYISSTNNATWFNAWDGSYRDYDYWNEESSEYYYIFNVVEIPTASSVKVKCRYSLNTEGSLDTFSVGTGKCNNISEWEQNGNYSREEHCYEMGEFEYLEETFEDTDSITFMLKIHVDNVGVPIDALGYYAEVYGIDENGNKFEDGFRYIEKEGNIKNTYSPLKMAEAIDAIETGVEIPEEAFVFTRNCSYRLSNNGWNWFINMFEDRISTENITNANSMFYFSNALEKITFDINFQDGENIDCYNMFNHCQELKEIKSLKNLCPSKLNGIFSSCNNLRYLPQIENFNSSKINSDKYASNPNVFNACYSLREIPEDFLKQLWGIQTTSSYVVFYNEFYQCYALGEIRGMNPNTGILTGNVFINSFTKCNRVKDIVFSIQEDGSPYVVQWKAQTIDLSSYIGYAENKLLITMYNSGITEDKEVIDDATYAALKNNPEWFTANVAYSRYNHDSAVNTINSLPDTSAYLATSGGTNTIKFKGEAGSATDGGAINTLTEEEIAVATAKGWTVSFA